MEDFSETGEGENNNMQLQQASKGVASETYCLQTNRQLTLFKELKPNFQMTAGITGGLINIGRFADSNTN